MKLDIDSIVLFLFGVVFTLIASLLYRELTYPSYDNVKSTLQEVESICKNLNSTPKEYTNKVVWCENGAIFYRSN